MQQALKFAPRTAQAQVVATELFAQFDIAMHETLTALDVGF